MKNKNGFTLIEVLAVIVIIVVLALILVPVVLDKVEKAEKKAFEISVELVKKNTENYLLKKGIKQLPDCEDSIVNVKELNLKNKESAFSLDDSHICYDSKQQCNYIYAVSKKENYKIEGCYDDSKINELDKKSDYSAPKYNSFVVNYQSSGLNVDIDWYDDESGIAKTLYAIKEYGTLKWSDWQEDSTFSGIDLEKRYIVKSKAINNVGIKGYAEKNVDAIEGDTPTCILSISGGTLGNSGYYKTNVTVTMKTSTVLVRPISFSGPVTSTTPSYDNSVPTGIGTSTYTVTKNGVTNLYGYVKTSDNEKSSCTKKVIKDTNPESVSITATDYTSGWSNKDVTLKANIKEGTSVSGYRSSYTYQWYKDDAIISGATSSTYLAKESGNYKVKAISRSGKSATSDKFNVLVDTVSPSKPSINAKNYGRSIDFNYSSSDSGSGINHYVLKYIDSSVMGSSSTKYESVILDSGSNTYSINSETSDTYKYSICAVDKAGNESCSNEKSITTYMGIRAASRSVGSKIRYGTKDWYVLADSGSTKGSYLTLVSADVAGYPSGGNSYDYANTYLNDQSLTSGYMASNSIIKRDCNNGGIIKQNGNCITSDSGSNGYNYYTSLSSPYWIGSGKVVVPFSYTIYSGYNTHKKAIGAAGSFTNANPNKNEITSTYNSYASSTYQNVLSTLYPSNSQTSFSYNGAVTRSSWYGSDYFIYFMVRPKSSSRLSVSKYAVLFDCDGDPQNCTTGNSDSYQEFTGTGILSVKVCGGGYMSSYPYLSWKASSSSSLLYGRGSSAFSFDSWSSSKSMTNVYVAGKSTSTTVSDSTYGVKRLYDNRSSGNCVDFGNDTISSVTSYFYYRPYIYVYESYDKDGK